MPKQRLTIRDWSGGINNRQDPRDIRDNECSFIENMSIDALGKIKTAGGLFDNLADSDGDTSSTPLTEYIVNRTAGIEGSGGYGLFYFESDHSRDNEQTITDTRFGNAVSFTDATCDTTNTNTTVAHDANASIVVGLAVSGTGIPTGAIISSITNTTSFVISSAATASGTNVTLTFTSSLAIGSKNGNINFVLVQSSSDEGTYEEASGN